MNAGRRGFMRRAAAAIAGVVVAAYAPWTLRPLIDVTKTTEWFTFGFVATAENRIVAYVNGEPTEVHVIKDATLTPMTTFEARVRNTGPSSMDMDWCRTTGPKDATWDRNLGIAMQKCIGRDVCINPVVDRMVLS